MLVVGGPIWVKSARPVGLDLSQNVEGHFYQVNISSSLFMSTDFRFEEGKTALGCCHVICPRRKSICKFIFLFKIRVTNLELF